MNQEEKIYKLDINLLIPNKYQPRKQFSEESLNELAASIKEYGIINPLIVSKTDDKYEIIAGERRYRAAKKIGLTEVPVIIKTLEEKKKAEIALIENLQRENLNPIEEARSYQDIMKVSNMTQQALGEKLGKSQSAIANKLRLLNLPENIQQAIYEKRISEKHARSLMKVESEEEQTELLKKVIENKMTVKELDNLINQNEITENDIKEAIDDIMKSLKITEEIEEKELKESDNMNNGNFFPNFNNMMGNNNNVSLNSMNMQSMVQQPVNPQSEEMVIPPMGINAMPEPMPQMVNTPVMPDVPLFNQEMNNNVPSFEEPKIIDPVMEAVPHAEETPLFGGDFNQPVEAPIYEAPQTFEMPMQNNFVEPEQNLFTPSVEIPLPQPEPIQHVEMNHTTTEMPLFNPEMNNNVPSFEEPSIVEPVIEPVPQLEETPLFGAEFNQPIEPPVYEAPVTPVSFDIPVMMEQPVDKLTELKNWLEEKGIEYKAYSNEEKHCIIIEM